MNHDRVMRDQFCWNLPDEALGLLKRLECMVGSTVRGNESGYLCDESGRNITIGDLVFVLGHGDDARENGIRESLKLLLRARQIKCNHPDLPNYGHLHLCFWKNDQQEGGQE
jgi:predicted phosphodiesterase